MDFLRTQFFYFLTKSGSFNKTSYGQFLAVIFWNNLRQDDCGIYINSKIKYTELYSVLKTKTYYFHIKYTNIEAKSSIKWLDKSFNKQVHESFNKLSVQNFSS